MKINYESNNKGKSVFDIPNGHIFKKDTPDAQQLFLRSQDGAIRLIDGQYYHYREFMGKYISVVITDVTVIDR